MNFLTSKAQQTVKAFRDRERNRQKKYIGQLGDGHGNVNATRGGDWIYVRLSGQNNKVSLARNTGKVPPVEGVIVDLIKTQQTGGSHYAVDMPSSSITYSTDPTYEVIGAHARQHEMQDFSEGGYDVVNVYKPMIAPMRMRAQDPPDWTVYVEPDDYEDYLGARISWAGGSSPALSKPASVNERRCDLVYFGTDHALHISQGTSTVDGSVPTKPTQPDQTVAAGWVYLDWNTPSISQDYIADARMLWRAITSTMPATPHNILSAQHADTTISTPSNNDLLTWDGTTSRWIARAASLSSPGWAFYENITQIGTPPGHFYNADLTAPSSNAMTLWTADTNPVYFIAIADIPPVVSPGTWDFFGMFVDLAHGNQDYLSAIVTPMIRHSDGSFTALATGVLGASLGGGGIGYFGTEMHVSGVITATTTLAIDDQIVIRLSSPQSNVHPLDFVGVTCYVGFQAPGIPSFRIPSNVSMSSLASGHIFVGNASNVATDVAMSNDATIANTGALTIANKAVTLAKMDDMATASLIYRKTAGTGAPEVNSLATLKTDLGTMPPTAHAVFDSTYHSDVLTTSPLVRGSIPYVNATPKLATLAKGAAGTYPTWDANDLIVSKVTITQPATGATLTIADNKTLTANNTLTLSATDGATLAIGTGGTLGSAAYTSSSAYDASGAAATVQGNLNTHIALTTSAHGGIVPSSRTVNGKALSADIVLGLASADFANQGTTTTVLHGNAAGNPSFSAVALGDLANASAQYHIPVSGAIPFAYAESGFLLGGTTGGKTVLNVTNAKVLTLTSADTYTLTIPASITALGRDSNISAGRIIYGSDANTVTGDGNLTWSSVSQDLSLTGTLHIHTYAGTTGIQLAKPSQIAFYKDNTFGDTMATLVPNTDSQSALLITATGIASNTDARVTLKSANYANTASIFYDFVTNGTSVYASIYNSGGTFAGFGIGSGTIPTHTLEVTGTASVSGHVTLEGVTSTGATGTGKLVFDTSPTFTTPSLGTPTGGTLTNCTGLPEAGLTLADNLTANASTSAHGLVVKAVAPAANILNVVGITNGETAYTVKSIFDGTNPAALGTAAPGTSLIAAHRDHVHPTTNLALLDTGNSFTVNQSISTTVSGGNIITLINSGDSIRFDIYSSTGYGALLIRTTGFAQANLVLQGSGGNLGIGNTGPTHLTDWESSGGGYYSATDHSFHNGSSRRYKNNVTEIRDALEKVKKLVGVEYDWDKKHGGHHALGFVAEEVGKVLPTAVDWKNEKDAYGYNPAQILAVAVNAIRELDARITQLEK